MLILWLIDRVGTRQKQMTTTKGVKYEKTKMSRLSESRGYEGSALHIYGTPLPRA